MYAVCFSIGCDRPLTFFHKMLRTFTTTEAPFFSVARLVKLFAVTTSAANLMFEPKSCIKIDIAVSDCTEHTLATLGCACCVCCALLCCVWSRVSAERWLLNTMCPLRRAAAATSCKLLVIPHSTCLAAQSKCDAGAASDDVY